MLKPLLIAHPYHNHEHIHHILILEPQLKTTKLQEFVKCGFQPHCFISYQKVIAIVICFPDWKTKTKATLSRPP